MGSAYAYRPRKDGDPKALAAARGFARGALFERIWLHAALEVPSLRGRVEVVEALHGERVVGLAAVIEGLFPFRLTAVDGALPGVVEELLRRVPGPYVCPAPGLDTMLGGKGYFRGSSILISGTAGTGKTSVAAHFVDAACRRGERSVFFAFEESPSQIIRNMRSIGIDLQQWVEKGLLQFHAERPTVYGLEAHLASMEKIIDLFKPKVVIVDPVTNLISVGSEADVKAMLIRLLDQMKSNQTTALFTTLTGASGSFEMTEVGTSSLTDTWLLLRDIEI